MVELAANPTRDVDVHPVEDAPAALRILVEPQVEQVAQEAAALGRAVGDQPLAWLLPAAQEARRVAECQQPRADYRRVGRGVDQLVDFARAEAAFEQHIVRAGALHAVLINRREAPALARNLGRLRVLVVARKQPRRRIAEVGGRIAGLSEMADRPRRRIAVGPQVRVRLSRQRRAGGGCVGRVEPQDALHVGRVPLPGDRRHGEAAAEEEPVAGMQRIGERFRARRAIEEARRERPPAIGHIDQQRPVALRRVDGLHQDQIAGEPHAAVRAARREAEVGDQRRVRRGGIDGVMQAPAHQLIGARIAEAPPLGIRLALEDLKPLNTHRAPPLRTVAHAASHINTPCRAPSRAVAPLPADGE